MWKWYDNPFWIVAIVLFGIMVILLPAPAIWNHALLPGSLAQIETLLISAESVDVREGEAVIGQIITVNRIIASQQIYNQLWWSAWAIPNAWDDVMPIEIPKRN